MGIGTTIAGIIIVVVAIGLIYYAYTTTSITPPYTTVSGSSSGTTAPGAKMATVPIGMTDPPSVPPGTKAVLVSYTDVQVHTTGSNGGSWVTATGTGTVNMTGVVNASQTIANARVAVNSTINAVRMNVTSAKVLINGTAYTAEAPTLIVANVSSNNTVRGNSAILIDVRSNVTANTNATSHTTTYAYTSTAAKGAFTTNATVSLNIGAIVNLSSALKASLGLNLI